MKQGDPVASATHLMVVGGVLCTLLIFFQLSAVPALWLQLLWVGFGPALYGVDALFLRRARSLQSLILLNAAAGVLLFAVQLLAGTLHGDLPLVIGLFGCGWLSYQAAMLHQKAIALSQVIQFLDIGLLLLTLFVAYLSSVEASLLLALPLALGCAGAIVGMVSYRAGGALALRDWGLLLGLLAAMAGVACLWVGTLARGAGQGLADLWKGLCALCAGAVSLISAFLHWLSSFAGEESYDTLQAESGTTLSVAQAEEAMPELHLPGWIFALVAVLLVAGVLYLLWYSGRVRVRGHGTVVQRKKSPKRSRISLWRALLLALGQLGEGLRLRLYLLLHRGTALGVFYRLVRARYGRVWRQGIALTPREFLTREAAMTEKPEQQEAILALIAPVEAALYTREGRDTPFPQASIL